MKSRPKILLIEDDASIVGGLKKELHAEGYEVAVAEVMTVNSARLMRYVPAVRIPN